MFEKVGLKFWAEFKARFNDVESLLGINLKIYLKFLILRRSSLLATWNSLARHLWKMPCNLKSHLSLIISQYCYFISKNLMLVDLITTWKFFWSSVKYPINFLDYLHHNFSNLKAFQYSFIWTNLDVMEWILVFRE